VSYISDGFRSNFLNHSIYLCHCSDEELTEEADVVTETILLFDPFAYDMVWLVFFTLSYSLYFLLSLFV